jgi:hypothetical protein
MPYSLPLYMTALRTEAGISVVQGSVCAGDVGPEEIDHGIALDGTCPATTSDQEAVG